VNRKNALFDRHVTKDVTLARSLAGVRKRKVSQKVHFYCIEKIHCVQCIFIFYA
jgi:hypothetical protein